MNWTHIAYEKNILRRKRSNTLNCKKLGLYTENDFVTWLLQKVWNPTKIIRLDIYDIIFLSVRFYLLCLFVQTIWIYFVCILIFSVTKSAKCRWIKWNNTLPRSYSPPSHSEKYSCECAYTVLSGFLMNWNLPGISFLWVCFVPPPILTECLQLRLFKFVSFFGNTKTSQGRGRMNTEDGEQLSFCFSPESPRWWSQLRQQYASDLNSRT